MIEDSFPATIVQGFLLFIFTVFLVFLKYTSFSSCPSFPSSIPFPFDICFTTELMFIISSCTKAKNLCPFFTEKRKKLGSIFYMGRWILAAGKPGPVLVIAHPDDQDVILKKERELGLRPALPDTALDLLGHDNIQNMPVGKMHAVYRKLLSSLLSPKALESFVPLMIQHFDELWKSLETRSSRLDDENGTIKIRAAIQDAQLKLMCSIFYGMEFETDDEKKRFKQFAEDFVLCAKGFFPPGGKEKKSIEFQEGMKAKKRITKVLNERFDRIYEDRLRVLEQSGQEEQENKAGNAMETIADELIKSQGKNKEGFISYEVARNNLFLRLEASQGTTQQVTSNMMYFLNHPDNKQSLDMIRNEVAKIESPTYEHLKSNMQYGDACIKEALRLATFVGGVSFFIEKGKSFELRKKVIKGPITIMLTNSHWYHDKEAFPQPESYLPERWIVGNKLHSEFGEQVYRPFGYGRHICLGSHLAKLVMKANLYCFAQNQNRCIMYDFENVNIVPDFFPENKISDDFPGYVVTSTSE